MDRRRFTSFIGASLLVADSFAAQPAKLHRIGYLGGTPPSAEPYLFEGFFQGLRELGYVEGENFLLEGRYYGDRIERLPALAAELVQLKVDVIVAGGPPAPEAAYRATKTIPIIMAYHPDPVGSGLAASLARPGGNVTGMSMLMPELVGKQLQLLKEAIPGMSRVAVLSNPTVPTNALLLKEAEAAARLMNVQLQVLDVRAPGDFDSAFSAMIRNRSHALIVLGSSIFFADRARIVALASENRLPSMYLLKQYVQAGGFMSYGASNRESIRRAATYVDKVLKGAKPADLPIEQATKLELNINLKTAKALGLTIPQGLLQRADEVIQ